MAPLCPTLEHQVPLSQTSGRESRPHKERVHPIRRSVAPSDPKQLRSDPPVEPLRPVRWRKIRVPRGPEDPVPPVFLRRITTNPTQPNTRDRDQAKTPVTVTRRNTPHTPRSWANTTGHSAPWDPKSSRFSSAFRSGKDRMNQSAPRDRSKRSEVGHRRAGHRVGLSLSGSRHLSQGNRFT